jgi:hypothetical protein
VSLVVGKRTSEPTLRLGLKVKMVPQPSRTDMQQSGHHGGEQCVVTRGSPQETSLGEPQPGKTSVTAMMLMKGVLSRLRLVW